MTSFVGTGALVRLALRRDRVRLPAWIVTITALVAVLAVALADLYPTLGSRQAIGAMIAANPALQAVLGPLYDATSIGGLVAWRMSFAAIVLVPLMALFAVVRHTRAEEEAGRTELLGSTVMGRQAPLTAALIVACGASLVLGAAVAATLMALEEPVVGSVALGAAYALAGCTFAGVGAVVVQLAESSRAASGLGVALLGVFFLVRSVGDAAAEPALEWLTWLSPLGWVLEIRPYAGERWWVAGLLAAFVIVLAAAAYLLVEHRDLGEGLVPPAPGDAEAAGWLRGPLGLAWRLHRWSLLGWAVGLFTLGALYGAVAAGVGDLLAETPQLEELFRLIGGEQALIDAFFATTMALVGLITSGYAIHSVLRLRSEEVAARAEPVLATAVTRTAWALSHVAIAGGGAVAVLTSAGIGSGLTHGMRVGDVAGQIPIMIGAALVQLPAVLVVAALALVLFGLLPRAVAATWAALVGFLVLGQFGSLLQLDQWLLNISPFTHLPSMPGGELTWAPLLALTATALALGAVGILGLRQRDVG